MAGLLAFIISNVIVLAPSSNPSIEVYGRLAGIAFSLAATVLAAVAAVLSGVELASRRRPVHGNVPLVILIASIVLFAITVPVAFGVNVLLSVI
ncbi:hypothetical protein [Mycetocola zhadangensis]|nr:hypothetical protein [Mycetocola zhadangensis]GGE89076.1 hypothetical protein GCM10011313_09720 [Mycetocola zhadangensis]